MASERKIRAKENYSNHNIFKVKEISSFVLFTKKHSASSNHILLDPEGREIRITSRFPNSSLEEEYSPGQSFCLEYGITGNRRGGKEGGRE